MKTKPLLVHQLETLSARIAAMGLDPIDSERIAVLTDPNPSEDRDFVLLEDLPNRCGIETDDICLPL